MQYIIPFSSRFARFFLIVLCVSISTQTFAQPRKGLVEVVVSPEHSNWTYTLNERADFEVKILLNGQPLSDITATYELGPEQMPPEEKGEIMIKKGLAVIKGIKMKKPGFVRCTVKTTYEGRTYEGWATAGFAPENIQPVVQKPEDFDTFWENAKAELAKIPIDAQLTLMPDLCTPDINVYHVSLQNIALSAWRGPSRFFGVLSVPKAPGKYPAILNVPGAGVRPYGRDDRAAQGVIVLRVGIHGIPVNLGPEVYNELGRSALADYPTSHLDDLDRYYYKRVYMGCVRAIDFIFSMPEFDGENLAVTGGSQGGALSIITAGLDKRVNYLAAFYPALCDLTGYLEGRAGGWPHMFKNYDASLRPNWVKVAPYYDVVNFARNLTVPGWYSWGYNDNVCPPTSMYAAYNSISSPKELHVFHQTAHWTFPEQGEDANAWLMKMLKKE
ncbi:MAG: acetylxylan esterase [Bacteroidetes bacterium]|nr:acetylxylan esterase [Bacteroidota bacterium]